MANNCPTTLNSIDVNCELTAGGIKRVIVCPRNSIKQPTVDASNMLDPSTILKSADVSTGTDVKFAEYKFRPQTSSITSTATVDPAIGSSSVTTEITLQFTKMETEKRVSLQQLIGTGAVIMVQTYDGKWLWCGRDIAVYATSIAQQSGTAISDLNGYTVTLQDISLELPYFVNISEDEAMATSQIKALLTNVPASY